MEINEKPQITVSEFPKWLPSLRILKLLTGKVHPLKKIRCYRLTEKGLDHGQLRLTIDWVYLRDPLLQIEITGLKQKNCIFFTLQPKVIYGRKTDFFYCHVRGDVLRLFPILANKKSWVGNKVVLLFSIQGTSLLPGYLFKTRVIAKFPIFTSDLHERTSWLPSIIGFITASFPFRSRPR